jgi:hypothetical protein
MEPPRGPREPLSWRRAKSLDRLQNAQKDSESWDCQGPSLPTGPFREGLCRTASDGTRCLKSRVQSVEAQDPTAAAPSPEETKDLLSEQRPQQDAKKDKAQRQAPQGWLRFVVNLFFRMSPEEPKEKTNKKAKGKEGPPEPAEPPESLGEPAPRKKAHSKKASRKKNSQRQHGVEEARGTRDQEAESQEAKAAEASCGEGANLGPAARGEQTLPVSMVTPPQPLPQGLGCSELLPQTSQQKGTRKVGPPSGTASLLRGRASRGLRTGGETPVPPLTGWVTWGWRLASLSLSSIFPFIDTTETITGSRSPELAYSKGFISGRCYYC